MKSYKSRCLVLLFTLCCAGCANLSKLPLVTAETLSYKRGNSWSNVSVTATNVTITETEIRAESLDAVLTYPFIGTAELHVKGYVQPKPVK